jgi:hypothetical protein
MRNTLSTSHGPGLQLEDATRPIGPEQRPQHGRHAVARAAVRHATSNGTHSLQHATSSQNPLSKPLSERIPGGLCYTCRLALAGALMTSTREMHQTRSKPPCVCVSALNARSRSAAVLERHYTRLSGPAERRRPAWARRRIPVIIHFRQARSAGSRRRKHAAIPARQAATAPASPVAKRAVRVQWLRAP